LTKNIKKKIVSNLGALFSLQRMPFSQSQSHSWGSWGAEQPQGGREKPKGNKGGALDPITAYGDVRYRLGWENQPHKGSWLWESRHAL